MTLSCEHNSTRMLEPNEMNAQREYGQEIIAKEAPRFHIIDDQTCHLGST